MIKNKGQEKLYSNFISKIASDFTEKNWSIKKSEDYIYFKSKTYTEEEQGWKIHIACQALEVVKLLQLLIPVVEQTDITFKVISTIDGIIKCNNGDRGVSQIGKVVTIYPNNPEQAYSVGKKIDQLWHQSDAAAPPSDLFFRENGNVSLRYGAFNTKQYLQDKNNISRPAIKDDKGLYIPDISSLDSTQPEWAPALPGALMPHPYFGKELFFLKSIENNRYAPLILLAKKIYSVALACLDQVNNRLVLLKIYHKKSVEDLSGHTVLARGENEIAIRNKLKGKNIAPELLDIHEDDYFVYVVSEYIAGTCYVNLSRKERIKKFPIVLKKLQTMHDLHIVHRDFKLLNLMATNDDVFIIDFELSSFEGNKSPLIGGTEGYVPPEGRNDAAHRSYDLFSLASCMVHAFTGVDAGYLPVKAKNKINATSNYLPLGVQKTIEALYSVDPEFRPAANECLKSFPKKVRAKVTTPVYKLKKAHFNIAAILQGGIQSLINDTTDIDTDTAIFRESEHTAAIPAHQLGLNSGIGGKLLGFLAATKALNQTKKYETVIHRAIQYISDNEALSSATGLFTGTAGAAMAIATAGQLLDQAAYLQLSYDLLLKASKTNTACDLFSGVSGIAYTAIKIYQMTKDERFLQVAAHCVDQIVDNKQTIEKISVWNTSENGLTEKFETGVAHGTAGIALVMAMFGIETNSRMHINYAVNCFKEIFAHARSEEAGYLHQNIGTVRHPTSNKNWCHGAAGYLWALIQLPSLYNKLQTEIKWSLSVCSDITHLSNPTYCHGMAGSLELWRMVNATKFRSETTKVLHDNTLYELVNSTQKFQNYHLFSSENPGMCSPDFWVGYMGPIGSLALEMMGSETTILNTKW